MTGGGGTHPFDQNSGLSTENIVKQG